jgi:hypothetical protein
LGYKSQIQKKAKKRKERKEEKKKEADVKSR